MQLNDIESMWKEDSQMDSDNLHDEAIKIPQLHGKYYEIQNKIYQLKKVKEAEYNFLYTEKTLYYNGKADPEVYNNKPFPHKILKADVHLYLNSDEELIKAKSRFDYCTYMMNYVTDILKMIHNRSFQIRDSIEFSKFIAGQ
jgi:hypothetical protein